MKANPIYGHHVMVMLLVVHLIIGCETWTTIVMRQTGAWPIHVSTVRLARQCRTKHRQKGDETESTRQLQNISTRSRVIGPARSRWYW